MKKIFLAASVLISLLLIFTGCAQSSPEVSPSPSEEAIPTPSPTEDTRAKVNVAAPDYASGLINEMAQTYMDANQEVIIEVSDASSNLGIAALAQDSSDIALSSRVLKDAEKKVFPGLKEAVLCTDGIAVIVNSENTVSSLTAEQVKDIFTGKITNWSEVGAEEGEIGVLTMDAAAELRKVFNSLFLGVDDKGNQIETDDYMSYTVETGEELIAEVLEDKDAIGYVPLSEVVGDVVKTIDIDGIKASAENIKSGEYKYVLNYILITRSLSAEAQEFFDYCTGAEAKAYLTAQRLIMP